MKNLILIFSLALIFTGCNFSKDSDNPKPNPPQTPQLPPETLEGKGTFGCYVNGELWLPTSSFYNFLHGTSSYPDQFSVSAPRQRRKSDGSWISESISVGVLSGITGPGTYVLNTGPGGAYYSHIDNNTLRSNRTDSLNSGILEITRWRSPDSYIVSGRFHFTVVLTGNDTIRVTDGRFDIGLYAYSLLTL